MFKTTRALVLREVKYKEADKILTLLTDSEGKLTVSARGVMRGGSQIAAACQLLAFSDMTLYERQGKLYIKEAQTIEQFLGLRRDISSLALGTYFAELLEALSDEDSPNPAVLSLGLNALFALGEGLYNQEHIKAVFEMRLMCLSGFAPSLDCCPICGGEPEGAFFGALDGGVLCKKCRGLGAGESFSLDGGTLNALRHIAFSQAKRVFSFAPGAADGRRLSEICEAYVIAHLERRFPALDYWKSVR